jgi:hypothetical protein
MCDAVLCGGVLQQRVTTALPCYICQQAHYSATAFYTQSSMSMKLFATAKLPVHRG